MVGMGVEVNWCVRARSPFMLLDRASVGRVPQGCGVRLHPNGKNVLALDLVSKHQRSSPGIFLLRRWRRGGRPRTRGKHKVAGGAANRRRSLAPPPPTPGGSERGAAEKGGAPARCWSASGRSDTPTYVPLVAHPCGQRRGGALPSGRPTGTSTHCNKHSTPRTELSIERYRPKRSLSVSQRWSPKKK